MFYLARDGFMGIGPLWANNDDGTVYMQGHIVISNPWEDAVTNGTTTTTTDNTVKKNGGDLSWYRPGVVRRCECDPPLGFDPGIVSADYTGSVKWSGTEDIPVKDMSCEQLGNAMKWAKEDFDRMNDSSYDGSLGDIDNPHDAEAVFDKDTSPDREVTYTVCEYWQVKEELMKRHRRGECLDIPSRP
jgi:hypothetical protein